MIPLPLGKLPAQPARPQLRARRFLDTRTLPEPPEFADWMAGVRDWPMYGNDRYGDCVFAGIAHQEQQISFYGQGTEVRVTERDVLDGYSIVTGFNPADPSTDQGTYTQDAMAWWRKTGLAGHRILSYASIDPTDTRLIRQCITLFGAVGVGFNFPRSAWAQFDAGRPWDVVPGSPIEGGHYIMVGAYGSDWWECVTWAKRQRMTSAFWRRFVDEVWLVIDDEMANQLTGMAFSGVDLYTLGKDFTALTGEPNPVNPPTPMPTPVTPSVDDADRALWAADGPWALADGRIYRQQRRNLVAWAKGKGLA